MQKVLGPQGTHQPRSYLVHTGKQQPLHDLQTQRLSQVSITCCPSPGFLIWEVLIPRTAAVSPAHPACGGGEERSCGAVTCASSPLAPSTPGILSNTLNCHIMEQGRIFLHFLPHQKGFMLVFLVLWTTHNKELWETQCQCSAGRALTLPAGRTEPLLRLLAGVARSLLPDTHSRAPGECPCPSPLPSVPTETSHLLATAGRTGGTLKLMNLGCNIFLFLSVIDFSTRGIF